MRYLKERRRRVRTPLGPPDMRWGQLWRAVQTGVRTLGRWGDSHIGGGVQQRTWWLGLAVVVAEFKFDVGDSLPLHQDAPSPPLAQVHLVVSEQAITDFLHVYGGPKMVRKQFMSPYGRGRVVEVVVFRPDLYFHEVPACDEHRRSVIFGFTVREQGPVLRWLDEQGVA